MKNHVEMINSIAVGTNYSAILVNWFVEYDPVLQGIVYFLAILTSLIALYGWFSQKIKGKHTQIKKLDLE